MSILRTLWPLLVIAFCNAGPSHIDDKTDLSARIDELEERILSGQVAGRPAVHVAIELPRPLLRRDLTRYIQALELDLDSHAHFLQCFHFVQAETLMLQEQHLPEIWRLTGELASQSRSLSEKAILTEELHARRLHDYRTRMALVEDRLLTELFDAADQKVRDVQSHWIECDRNVARFAATGAQPLPGSNLNLVSILDDMEVEFDAADPVEVVLRQYVLEFGPLARNCHHHRVESAARDAQLVAELDVSGASPDFVERRQRIHRQRIELERRMRDLNATFAARLADVLDPTNAENLRQLFKSARCPRLQHVYEAHATYSGHISRWKERDGLEPSEAEFLAEFERKYHQWYNGRIAALERRIDEWNDHWYSTFAGSREEMASLRQSIQDFDAAHRAYFRELGDRANALLADRQP